MRCLKFCCKSQPRDHLTWSALEVDDRECASRQVLVFVNASLVEERSPASTSMTSNDYRPLRTKEREGKSFCCKSQREDRQVRSALDRGREVGGARNGIWRTDLFL